MLMGVCVWVDGLAMWVCVMDNRSGYVRDFLPRFPPEEICQRTRFYMLNDSRRNVLRHLGISIFAYKRLCYIITMFSAFKYVISLRKGNV